jgi:hypothetical protein
MAGLGEEVGRLEGEGTCPHRLRPIARRWLQVQDVIARRRSAPELFLGSSGARAAASPAGERHSTISRWLKTDRWPNPLGQSRSARSSTSRHDQGHQAQTLTLSTAGTRRRVRPPDRLRPRRPPGGPSRHIPMGFGDQNCVSDAQIPRRSAGASRFVNPFASSSSPSLSIRGCFQ